MGTFVTRVVALANLDKFAYIGIFSGGTVSPSDISDKSKVKLVFMSFGSRERGADGLKIAADSLAASWHQECLLCFPAYCS